MTQQKISERKNHLNTGRREKISENTGVKQIDDVNMIKKEAHLENPAEKVNQSS